MEYKSEPTPLAAPARTKPRLIIHGGAGNISRKNMTPAQYTEYRTALLDIVTRTNRYMNDPVSHHKQHPAGRDVQYPSALDIATHAVTLLEDNPLFNSGHGAVFTRDGINELEASVMVSRGRAKRGVGVTGLRHVKNPILLAKAMLEHGDNDLRGKTDDGWAAAATATDGSDDASDDEEGRDVPSAQGHTLLHGETAEILARRYGLELVDPKYFFTQKRWDEHVRALEKEEQSRGRSTATWSADEYLPQGTCGAVALDVDGVVCVATSTGGMTNKLTGRIGDTPIVGAGFWAEEWTEEGDPSGSSRARARAQRGADTWPSGIQRYLSLPGQQAVELSSTLRSLLADCLPTPFVYTPLEPYRQDEMISRERGLRTTRSTGISGTGNGDSFLRLSAVRSVASIARWGGLPAAHALNQITGRGGELEKSAGDRWDKTGEGQGGMIGIEYAVTRDQLGRVVDTRSVILQDHNCAGMFRAWINDDGDAEMRIWHVDDEAR
ncbi:nucleophile aminohydrolase [Biscogniauxia marginata]|nr:nucleophile aminohydrolase [Biscogniauxia marginata]